MEWTTGNDIVDRISKMHLEGNIIPHTWYHKITLSDKPDLVAIVMLSEIVYWYRATYEKDEDTGRVLGIRKKFKADLLQRSYASFTEQFGITKRQAQDAMKRLEDLKLVTRHFRTVTVNGTNINNVLFIELHPEELEKLTYGDGGLSRSNGRGYHVQTGEAITLKRETNTKITSKITTQTKRVRSSPKMTDYTEAFEQFWSVYPRRIGKKEAFSKWVARLNSGVSEEELILAATNYAKKCKADKTEERYMMHPSTFLGPNDKYVDYLSPQPEQKEKPDKPADPRRKPLVDENFIKRFSIGDEDDL
ncbi:hypothetical protein [Brevibacillus migulae]|uniref:hypothetical protein n=1 Tax=Brevibacillus migulae TaxID=1644114 RepID=UPI00106DF4B4|nr:hypothetical protein [Brevibacillus migulae]